MVTDRLVQKFQDWFQTLLCITVLIKQFRSHFGRALKKCRNDLSLRHLFKNPAEILSIPATFEMQAHSKIFKTFFLYQG